ncbi:MAG: S1 RNA-binding domain-containing protein [Patescibacteria group bacterium]
MNIAKNGTLILTQLTKTSPQIFSSVKVGDLVDGTVLDKSSRALLVDLGRHGTGVVYRGELQNARELVKSLDTGSPIHAKVIEVDNDDGFIELSLSEAGKQKAWGEVDELRGKDEAFTVKITGFNKGGLITSVKGIPAFLPVSQLAADHYPKAVSAERTEIGVALQKLVGEEISVKVIDANPRMGKLILSEKEATEISSRELAKNYEVGQVVDGLVSGVADFGVFVKFVDNPAVEGLIHVSELDYRIIENPKDVVKVDDVVKAKIMDIKDGKISLSLKAMKVDPWLVVADTYSENQGVKGKVYMFNPFGAIINLDETYQGYVHVTEFGSVEEMKKHLAVGNEYSFVIDAVKPTERKITLKMKK